MHSAQSSKPTNPSNSLIELGATATQPLSVVGGKAHALGRLIDFGAPVPPGFVVPPYFNLAQATAILTSFDRLNAEFVAVRSSATGEDAHGQSWAGQFESFLYVTRNNLIARIADCRASSSSNRAQAYGSTTETMAVAVIVQVMVPAEVSGVLFTANPVTKNRQEIVIEAVYGLAEQLVQGLATPDSYLLDHTGKLLQQSTVPKATRLVGSTAGVKEEPVPVPLQHQPALSPQQCHELTTTAVTLESRFGHPLDIEWAYAYNKLYIVQARPITTL